MFLDDRPSTRQLGEACGSCGWRVHDWVLMGNHFHLLLETPQANLVAGMKWGCSVFSAKAGTARADARDKYDLGKADRKATLAAIDFPSEITSCRHIPANSGGFLPETPPTDAPQHRECPLFPRNPLPSGPAQRLFQEPPAKSKFLAF